MRRRPQPAQSDSPRKHNAGAGACGSGDGSDGSHDVLANGCARCVRASVTAMARIVAFASETCGKGTVAIALRRETLQRAWAQRRLWQRPRPQRMNGFTFRSELHAVGLARIGGFAD